MFDIEILISTPELMNALKKEKLILVEPVELSNHFELSQVMISRCKKEFTENMYKAFEKIINHHSEMWTQKSSILKLVS